MTMDQIRRWMGATSAILNKLATQEELVLQDEPIVLLSQAELADVASVDALVAHVESRIHEST